MDRLASSAEKVASNNPDSVLVRSEVSEQVGQISKDVEAMKLRLRKRRDQLRRRSMEQECLDDVIEEFSSQLEKIEARQEQEKPVSALFDVLGKQRKTCEYIVDDVQELKNDYRNIERKVKESMDEGDQEEKVDKILGKFDKIGVRFNDIKKAEKERREKIKQVEKPSAVYFKYASEFRKWLTDVENRVQHDSDRQKGVETLTEPRKIVGIFQVTVECADCILQNFNEQGTLFS